MSESAPRFVMMSDPSELPEEYIDENGEARMLAIPPQQFRAIVAMLKDGFAVTDIHIVAEKDGEQLVVGLRDVWLRVSPDTPEPTRH